MKGGSLPRSVMADLQETLTSSYARWRASRLGQVTDRLEEQLIFELLGPIAGKTLLDIGCGDAAFAAALAREGAQVSGLDPDSQMLMAARRRANQYALSLHLIEGRAEDLPFHDDAFDLALAITSLCFVENARGAVSEMARILKPGGRLVIGDLGRWSLWALRRRLRGWLGDPTWSTARFRSGSELRRLVRAAGLAVIETRGAMYYPPNTAAARLLAPADSWLGRATTLGAAFIAVSAQKPLNWTRTKDG